MLRRCIFPAGIPALRAAFACLLVACATLGTAAVRAQDATSFAEDVLPLVKTHCHGCHGADVQEAGVQLARFADEKAVLREKKVWRRVAAQLKNKTMPPADEPPLTDADRERLLAGIQPLLARSVEVPLAERDPGPSGIRRLTHTEYNHTIRDLLGVDDDIAASVGMADDHPGHGFDNLAAVLRLQAAHMEKYLAGADRALDLFFAKEARSPRVQAAHAAIFFVQPDEKRSKRQAAREIMQRLLPRAYRRPVDGAEVERYLKLYEAAGGAKLPLEDGVKAMMRGMLVSPHFLLRIEGERNGATASGPQRIGNFELASRWSYFLWSSAPDDALLAAASENQLAQPAEAKTQLARLLRDAKAAALSEALALQWLQLRKLDAARPTVEFFPTLTPALRDAMKREAILLVDDIRRNDRSVLTLLDANYTFVNGPLAEHYGLKGATGVEFARVELPADSPRGGLLGMAGILTLNSHTYRTSPTLRGKYLLEVVFGTPPPPPPANVSQLKEEDDSGKEPKDFREVLARHAKDATCAACHRKIDPLGFGLENFDAIGRWRDKHGSDPVDASGVLPSGEKFSGPRELKRYLLTRNEEFLRHVTEQMFIYALGRELEYYDEPAVDEVVARLMADGGKFSTLVEGVALSFPMNYRRAL